MSGFAGSADRWLGCTAGLDFADEISLATTVSMGLYCQRGRSANVMKTSSNSGLPTLKKISTKMGSWTATVRRVFATGNGSPELEKRLEAGEDGFSIDCSFVVSGGQMGYLVPR
ncbi:hypothetical protein ACLOJK_020064 [Asimina triloba]